MKIEFERNKTSNFIVMYSLYLHLLGSSLRNTSKALIIFIGQQKKSCFCLKLDSEVAVYPFTRGKEYRLLLIDETVFRLEILCIGYGFVLNQLHSSVLDLVFIFQNKEI